MMCSLAKLLHAQRGAAVIELALVAPIFATMIIGVVQLSNAYSTKLQLEQVAQRMVEKWQGAGFDNSASAITAVKAEAAAAANVATSAITIDYWHECASARVAYTATCSTGATDSRYATIDIQKSYTPMFSTKWLGAQSDGSYTLHGISGIRYQ